MTTIASTDIKTLLKEVVETVAYDYDNIVKQGKDHLTEYLKTAKITEREKAEMFSNFLVQSVSTNVQSAMMLAGDIAKTNAELAFRQAEQDAAVAKTNAEKTVLEEQLLQEQYKRLNIMPKELAILIQEELLKQEQVQTEDKRQLQMDAEIAKLGAEKLLVDEQTETEAKKNVTDGLIDRQTELYYQQGLSFKGHNLSKGADSIAQIVGMVVAEGAVPAPEIMSAHSKCVTDLAALSGTTLAGYSTAK